jgi:peptidoglycan/xylan/chitin deacetylase (PgdA/CDA1 family)
MQYQHKTQTRRPRKLLLRTIFAVIGIGIFIGLIGLTFSLSTTTQAVSQTEHLVQSVASFDTVNLAKPVPQEYNGKVRKIAYLTFDDGPSKYTADLLDILQEYNVKATFFMLGPNILKYEDTVKRMNQEGHYPGLHSMSHDHKTLYRSGGSTNFIREFTEAQAIVDSVTGFKPTLIRAPYGSAPQIGESFRGAIANAGFKMWDWTIDSNDWKYPNKPSAIVKDVKSMVNKNVEVILFHEKQQTLDALPEIITFLQKQGYELEAYQPESHIVMNFHKDTRL